MNKSFILLNESFEFVCVASPTSLSHHWKSHLPEATADDNFPTDIHCYWQELCRAAYDTVLRNCPASRC
jgi:hypothetical protein